LDYGFANYAIIKPEITEGTVPVKLGTVSSVKAVPAEDIAILIDKQQRDQVLIRTELEESVTAPVSRGQRLGTLTVSVGEQVLKQVPMVAKEGVQKLTWGDLFIRVLKKMAMAE